MVWLHEACSTTSPKFARALQDTRPSVPISIQDPSLIDMNINLLKMGLVMFTITRNALNCA